MFRFAWPLRWLIGGIYFLIMVTLLGTLALYVSSRTEQHNLDVMRENLSGQARLGAGLLAQLMQHEQEPPVESLRRIYTRVANTRNTSARRVTLYAVDGSVIAQAPDFNLAADGAGAPPVPAEVGRALKSGFAEGVHFDRQVGEEILVIAVPVRAKEVPVHAIASSPPPEGVLVLAAPLTEVKTTVKHIKTALALAFLGALCVLFFINIGLSTYISQPLAKLSGAAERIARGELSERVQPSGAAEVASLGDSFNRMAEQLRLTITRLAEERAQAEAMLTSIVDGVLVTDTQGHILLVNPGAEELCGLEAATAIGKTLTEAMFHFEMHDLMIRTISTGFPLKQELSFSWPTERIVEVHMAPVEVDGVQLGVVIVLYDITHQRRIEQVHRDFVANVSHELRTPVASIRAMTETLLEGGREDQDLTTDFLQTIIGESERLSVLLDDLLHLSRIEAGHHLITPRPLDLAALIRHVGERLIVPIAAKGQRLVLDIPQEFDVLADRDAVTQVLVNLLDNARKYSPDGATITVRVARKRDRVLLSVIDTGFGIPAGELGRIFERFYRVDKARSRAQGGTGLGLAIVKQLVELHGGRVYVDSEMGRGSTFTVSLPQAAAVTGEAGEPPVVSAAESASQVGPAAG